MAMRGVAACLLGLLALGGVRGIYLPGVTPVEYPDGATIRIKVNSFTSTATAIPYDYYRLPTCKPGGKEPKMQLENFGEILWGDRIKPSMYFTEMRRNITCRLLCSKIKMAKPQKETLARRINEQYRGHLIVDNLPVTEVLGEKMSGFRSYLLGYPMGTPAPKLKKGEKADPSRGPFVNNHLDLTILYHKPVGLTTITESKGYRIVGFHVTASSVHHEDGTCTGSDTWVPQSGNPVSPNEDEIQYSYSVKWVEDPDLSWGSRWDPYLANQRADVKIHWFSVTNSVIIVLFLSGMVAVILMRALHKDFNNYNNKENESESQEETGWKLVHADVFRPPPLCILLAVYVGTGSQILMMSLITLGFALLGFLSPANRGGLLTAMLLLYIMLGAYAGYISARLCKFFRQHHWINIFYTAIFYPGQVFCCFFVMNLVLWGKHASNATPFPTIVSLLMLWVGISLPLVFVGAAVGFKKDVISVPVRVNQLARNIPEQKMWMKPAVTIGLAGTLPFGAAFIEIFFVMSSIWLGRYYYVFGFLALSALILTITCAEISIVMVYFQLCYEDYNWWWRSFLISGASGVHLFIYSIFYFFSVLRMRQFWSGVVYFGWMSVLSYTFGIATGTIGFMASFIFVRHIYANIKVD